MPTKIRICELHLKNFRIFQEAQLSFNKNLVFFIGENGTGKTSILEAMAIMAQLRSFRRVKDEKLIHWGEDYYAISLRFLDGENEIHLHSAYSLAKSRRLLVNREKVSQLSHFLGRLPVVIFSPDDLTILDGGPAERRRFLDIILCTLSGAYLEALQNYQRLLNQRSVLLRKGIQDKWAFSAIDQELAKNGAIIMQKREGFIQEYHPTLKNYVQMISSGKDFWLMEYEPSIRNGQNEENYFKSLVENLPNDLRVKQTTKGIHRDRLLFFPPGKPQIEFTQVASQGQKRTLALALKMAQFSYYQERLNKIPVLLVDDVLNELDIYRRKAFVGFLASIGQAFFTTTEMGEIQEFLEQSDLNMPSEIYVLKRENNISQIYLQNLPLM